MVLKIIKTTIAIRTKMWKFIQHIIWFLSPISHLLAWRGRSWWPMLQLATRGRPLVWHHFRGALMWSLSMVSGWEPVVEAKLVIFRSHDTFDSFKIKLILFLSAWRQKHSFPAVCFDRVLHMWARLFVADGFVVLLYWKVVFLGQLQDCLSRSSRTGGGRGVFFFRKKKK